MSTIYQENIETDDINYILEKMNKFDDYKKVTNKDIPGPLYVDLNNPHAEINRKMSFYQSGSDSNSYFADIPAVLVGKTLIFYRDVLYRGPLHVMVVLTEALPVAGRTWTNFYNNGDWSGWTCIHSKDILLLSTTKYGVNFRIWGNPNEIHYRTSGSTNEEIPVTGKEVIIGTLPEGYRPKISMIKYFLAGLYRCQIRFLSSGVVELGYAATTSTGAGGNIPSGIGVYTFGSLSLQSGE